MTKTIPLTQGQVAIVDEDVYEWASKHKWHAHRMRGKFYAMRSVTESREKRWMMHLHREIMKPPEGVLVSFKNGNGLDCRRENMRLASSTEIQRYRGTPANNASGFKGVFRRKGNNGWRARIGIGGRQTDLGSFDTPEEAARAYDEAAKRHYGEFAKTNF